MWNAEEAAAKQLLDEDGVMCHEDGDSYTAIAIKLGYLPAVSTVDLQQDETVPTD
jgi:hypothetical protein